MTLQNQKASDEKQKHFPTNLISKIELQLKSYLNLLQQVRCFVIRCGENSIISSYISLTHNIIRGRTDEKKRWTKIEFWRIPQLMAHLEDDLCFDATHNLLLKKLILPQTQ